MELRFAVVEDRLPDAQRLESLLRLAFGGGQPLVCDHYESGDAFSGGVPLKRISGHFSRHLHGRHQRHRDGAHPAPGRSRPAASVRDFVPGIRMGRVPRPSLRLPAQALPEEKLFQLADELRRVLFRAEPELEVRIARQQVHLPLRKIQYAMAQNHYVRIVSDDGECRAVSTFSQVEQLLRAQENFIVCNRASS